MTSHVPRENHPGYCHLPKIDHGRIKASQPCPKRSSPARSPADAPHITASINHHHDIIQDFFSTPYNNALYPRLMSIKIPAGAYLIRNRDAFLVLHANDPSQHHCHVALEGRDEHRHRDSQVWWIEPIPGCEDSHEYTITNPRHAKAIEYDGGPSPSNPVPGIRLAENKGSPEQRWRIQSCTKDPGEENHHGW